MPGANWKRLGEMLVRRRIELDPRYANRQTFAKQTGVNYRTISDVERGRRDNYEDATLTALEVAYAVKPGSIGRALADGELEPLPGPRAAGPPSLRPVPPLPSETAGYEAEEILSGLLTRYDGDEVVGAMAAQAHKPAYTVAGEVLRWLERQGDEAPAREAVDVLLARHPGDEVLLAISRQSGKRRGMVAEEMLEWLGTQHRAQQSRNGTSG